MGRGPGETQSEQNATIGQKAKTSEGAKSKEGDNCARLIKQSEDLGVLCCSWWLDDRATAVTTKQPEEIAREIKAEKANPEKEYSLAVEKEEKETNSSSNEEQSRKTENQVEHSLLPIKLGLRKQTPP